MKELRGAMKKEIEKVLKKCEKDFDGSSQRAELLARNKVFLKELIKMKKYINKDFHNLKNKSEQQLNEKSEQNILIKMDYPKTEHTEVKGLEKEIELLVKNIEEVDLKGYEVWTPVFNAG